MARFLALLIIFVTFETTAFALRPFMIDTDAANDDAVAILYLLARSDIDVKAITIATTGEAHCQAAFRNIQGIIQLSQHRAIPLACGREIPLAGHHQFPDWIRSAADNWYGESASLPKSMVRNKLQALHLLTQTLQHSKQPIDILAIGPLTNIAELLQKHPELKSKIHRLYIMGGAIHVPGNVKTVEKSIDNARAEWNFYIDPLAASIVFKANIPITLIALDVTNQVPVTQAFYERLAMINPQTAVAHYIFRLFNDNKKKFLTLHWYFWDPLAAVVASNESLATFKTEKLRIITTEGPLSGAIVTDQINGNAITVTTKVVANQFYDIALQTLMNNEKNQVAIN